MGGCWWWLCVRMVVSSGWSVINGDKLVVIGGGFEKLVAKLEVKKSILAETGVRRQNW